MTPSTATTACADTTDPIIGTSKRAFAFLQPEEARRLIALTAISAVILGWLVFHPGTKQIFKCGDNALGIVAVCLASFWCFAQHSGMRRALDAENRWASRSLIFMGLGLLAFAIGETIW